MKKIFFIITDIVCFVGGSSVFIKTLFEFNINRFRDNNTFAGSYYYTAEQTYFLALGIGLIVLGFLIRNWRKGK